MDNRFVKALQHEHLVCEAPKCGERVEIVDLSQSYDRVKTFQLTCPRCGRLERVTGKLAPDPPWDNAALLEMAEEHILHQQPLCPNDGTPVVFTSLTNPRRRARYRLSCFYCGRQAEMDWPPPEARR
jgi:ribosomal protein S27AE